MTYSCKLCDKSKMSKSKYKHFKSITQKTLDESNMRRYIIPHPVFDQIDELLKKFFNIYNEKENYLASSVSKLLTLLKCVKYYRINTELNLDYFFDSSKNSILSRNNQDRYFFPHIYEMRITFTSSVRNMTYDYCLKQPMPLCASRIYQKLAKSPRLKKFLKRYSKHPLLRKHSSREIIFVNKRS